MITEHKVSVSPHRTLNSVKGVISKLDLLAVGDEEIVEVLSDEGVVEAKRITMRRDGKVVSKINVVLTFNGTKLPENVKPA